MAVLLVHVALPGEEAALLVKTGAIPGERRREGCLYGCLFILSVISLIIDRSLTNEGISSLLLFTCFDLFVHLSCQDALSSPLMDHTSSQLESR